MAKINNTDNTFCRCSKAQYTLAKFTGREHGLCVPRLVSRRLNDFPACGLGQTKLDFFGPLRLSKFAAG